MNSRLRFIFVVVGMFVLSVFASFDNASAASSNIKNKIDAYNIWRCYNSGQITRQVPDIYSFNGINSLFTNRQFLSEIGDGTESCVGLMTERLPSGVPASVETPEQGKELLTSLGYSPVAGKCYQIKLGYRTGSEVNGDGNYILSDKLCEKGDTFSVEKSNDKINVPGMNKVIYFDYDYQNNTITLNASVPSGDDGGIVEESMAVSLNNSGGLQGAMNRFNSFLINKQNNSVIDLNDAGIQYWSMGIESVTDEGYSYELKSTDSVGKAIASKLTGSEAGAFSKTEKRNLYENYLTSPDYYYVIQNCESETSPGPEYVETVISGGGIAKRCFVMASRMSGASVNGLNNGGYFDGTKKTWQEIARELYEDWKDEIGNAVDKNNEDISGVSAEEENACYDAGIDGISWIACPALTNLTYTANGFDGIIDGMLSIKSEYYDNNSDAYTVWEVMRNVANAAMILILLIIIVSQITGYGIDNYGIKKMLPKLIIVAVIMNFSFILCELIIDLSNIVGVGLRDIFGGIGQSIGNGAGKGIGEIVSVLLGIAAGAGAIAGSGIGAAIAAVGVISGPMIILMVIMALLGVIVSLLIFFASLGIRLMLVIICVGVAPVAMVCYILPNTKKGFDVWWKAFKACLIIYPICGAMLGISELIKGIAWSSTGGDDPSGVAMKLVALIAPYLPFFLLPSLLRGAISAVGNLSGVVNSISDRVRGAARGGADAVRNTEAFKDASSAVAMNRQNRAAMRAIDRLKNKTNLSEGEKRRLAKARSVVLANTARTNKEDNLVSDVGYEAALSSAAMDADNEEYKAYQNVISGYSRTQLADAANSSANWYDGSRVSQNRMKALISTMEANGMQNDIYKMLGTTNVGNSSKVMQSLANSKDKVLKAYGKRGGGQAYNEFMDNGGMRAYAKEKGTDFVKDLDDKSLGEIARHTTPNNQIMDGNTLSVAAATINAQDAIDNIDKLIGGLPADEVNFTPAELVSYNTSTVQALLKTRDGRVYDKLIAASDQIANNPELNTKLKDSQRAAINRVRTTRGMQPI